MSLYDGLGLDDKEGGKKEPKPDILGWGSSLKLLQSQKDLQKKKASLINLKKRNTVSVAPVVDLRSRGKDKDGVELHFNQQTGKMERVGGVPSVASPFIAADAPSSFLGVSDEYDPRRPNDYESYNKEVRERRNKEKDDDRKKEMTERERRRKERHRQQGYSDSDSDEEGQKRRREDEDRKIQRGSGAAIAPPQSIVEEVVVSNEPEEGSEEFGSLGMNLKGSVASKIMARMGYKSGAGLGRKEQGMSMALMVEKPANVAARLYTRRTYQNSAKLMRTSSTTLISKKGRSKVDPALTAAQQQNTADLLKYPSKVVLLRNMVGPGEVDPDLEAETMEECQKYGKVNRCAIFEIPNVIEEEAVRIFMEFEKIDAAIKAIIDLNGRFFGGRNVRACFYNLG